MEVHVSGQLIFNGIYEVLDAAVAGFRLAYVPDGLAQPYLDSGALQSVLADWSPRLSGYHIYYPNRRGPPVPCPC